MLNVHVEYRSIISKKHINWKLSRYSKNDLLKWHHRDSIHHQSMTLLKKQTLYWPSHHGWMMPFKYTSYLNACKKFIRQQDKHLPLKWQTTPDHSDILIPNVFENIAFLIVFQFHRNFFSSKFYPNRTQACSLIIGYIPGPIGSLFAIAPNISWSGNFANHSCTWALQVYCRGRHCLVVH